MPARSAATPQQVEQVRAKISQECSAASSDADVARFVRAVDGDIPRAVERLETTHKWRTKNKVSSVVCDACSANPQSHYMHVVGHDVRNQPVIYSVFSLAQDKDPDQNKQHMIHQFETAVRLMPPGVEKWVWVMDFHGFGMADCNPKIAKIFLTMTSAHYPERLSNIVVLGAPMLFGGLWSMLKPMIPDVTKEKIRFVTYDVGSKTAGRETREGLKDIFGEELLEWLIKETSDTRERVKSKKAKTYSLDLSFCPPEGSHDMRGTRSLVNMLREKPHLLTGHQMQVVKNP